MKSVFENKSNVLVTYFSWSGNTERIASQLQRHFDCDIFEIVAANDYSSVYRDVLIRARQENRSEATPELRNHLASIDSYDIIFVGFPNWCNTFPAPVRTFLMENDFTGKTIIPFCTHGGGGLGHSISDISQLCASGKVLNSFSINGYAVKDNNIEVDNWIRNN